MLSSFSRIHAVGCGGIGLSALLLLLKDQGATITGSDVAESLVIDRLRAEGIPVTIGHDATHVTQEVELLLYSPAVPEDNPERAEARSRQISQMSYPEALGELTKNYSTIVVTGTHGKSTTTALLGQMLAEGGYDPTVIVGSLVPGFEHGNLRVGRGRFLVVEGCEYRAHVLHLHPEAVVITNIEHDHPDFFASVADVRATFQTLIDRLKTQGLVVWNADDVASQQLKISGHGVSFGESEEAEYRATDRTLVHGGQRVSVERAHPAEGLGELTLRLPGAYNVLNVLAATAAAMELGVPFAACVQVASRFGGIWRRFERLGQIGQVEVVSDYGHHPTAVRAAVAAAREAFPAARVVLAFEPHQHARTAALFDEFVEALATPDQLFLSEIYRVSGRTEEENVSSRDLCARIKAAAPHLQIVYTKDLIELKEQLNAWISEVSEPTVLLVQGAGAIDSVARELMPEKRQKEA